MYSRQSFDDLRRHLTRRSNQERSSQWCLGTTQSAQEYPIGPHGRRGEETLAQHGAAPNRQARCGAGPPPGVAHNTIDKQPSARGNSRRPRATAARSYRPSNTGLTELPRRTPRRAGHDSHKPTQRLVKRSDSHGSQCR